MAWRLCLTNLSVTVSQLTDCAQRPPCVCPLEWIVGHGAAQLLFLQFSCMHGPWPRLRLLLSVHALLCTTWSLPARTGAQGVHFGAWPRGQHLQLAGMPMEGRR